MSVPAGVFSAMDRVVLLPSVKIGAWFTFGSSVGLGIPRAKLRVLSAALGLLRV